jgi:TM2 domain-containing membrane protein YozV
MALLQPLRQLPDAAQDRLAGLAHEARNRPSMPLLASLVVPGLGSMINGDVRKGALILAGFLLSIPLTVILLGVVGMFGFWLWGLIDAHDGATGWDEHTR